MRNSTLAIVMATMAGTFSVGACAADVGGSLAAKVKQFTPADVNIVVPGDDVPKDCAIFVGEWGPGLVPFIGAAVKMVVESVAPDCIAQVLVVQAEPKSYGNDPGASSGRHSVKITDRSFELKEVTPGSVWKVSLDASGQRLNVNARNAITMRFLSFAMLR